MMDIYYKNSYGDTLNLLEPPYMLQTGTLFDYQWEHVSRGRRIAKFQKEIQEKSALLSILNYGRDNYEEAVNYFHEVTEKDILGASPGRLYVGEMYLPCYIASSEKTEWETDIGMLDNEIQIVTDRPFWIHEHPYEFKFSSLASSDNKRYANRYAYRYANGLMNTAVINEHYADCSFRMVVYGPVIDPRVYIGGHEYLVKIILEENENLVIDSAAQTVTKVTAFGGRVNAFHNRNFVSSVFEPVHPGRQAVGWSGLFDFDLILYEERSEPKWSRQDTAV